MIETIRNAEAVWIAGGDQSNYIRYWKDTPVEDAINLRRGEARARWRHERRHGRPRRIRLFGEGKESLTARALAIPMRPT